MTKLRWLTWFTFAAALFVQALEPVAIKANAVAASCSPLGEQKIAVLMIGFPGVARPSATADDLRNMFFGPGGPSLDGYWREASYGRTWATGDVFGWFDVDRAYSCSEAGALRNAAVAAASKQVDLSQYNRFFIVFPASSAFTASCLYVNMTSKGCTAGVSAAFLPITGSLRPATDLQTAIYESGSSLGLDEAMGRRYAGAALGAPDDPGRAIYGGDPTTGMGGAPGALSHYDARQKMQLGWLAPSDVLDVTAPGDYQVAPLSSPSGSPKALRIQRPDTNTWLWVEYRPSVGLYESTIPPQISSGAAIHVEDHYLSGVSNLLDFTPGSVADWSGDFADAALGAGLSWSDLWTALSIAVKSADAQALTVAVGASSCASLSSYAASFDDGAHSGDVLVTAPPNCQWTVQSSQPWVTVASGAGGSGNGKVAYDVAAAGRESRQATLAIGRRAYAISQAGADQLATDVSVDPASGAGYSQIFTATYTDPLGAGDIYQTNTRFSDSGAYCTVSHVLSNGAIEVHAGSGGAEEMQSGTLGSPLVLTTSYCSVDLARSSEASSGNQYFLRLAMAFTPAFDGPKSILLSAYNSTVQSAPVAQLGSWNVGALPGAAPVIASGGVANAASYAADAVVPGEMVAIFGTGLGPANPVSTVYNAMGYLGTNAGGTKVFVNGIEAPVAYATGSQVNAIVPYGAAAGNAASAAVRVEFEGRPSNTVSLPLANADPGIFAYAGLSQGVIVNQDGSFNSAAQPAPRGSVVTLFATGSGATNPAGIDGKLPANPAYPVPVGTVGATFGGVPGQVQFAGMTFAGVLQVNVAVPANAPTGGSVPVVLTVGAASSPAVALALQ